MANARGVLGAVAGLCLLWPAAALAEDRPQLDWDEPVWCLDDDEGVTFHLQCDDKRCLYHDACLQPRGKVCRPMERILSCSVAPEGTTLASLKQKGRTMEPARGEAPPGWSRDGNGRVFQTEFDMNNRVWLGGRWSPVFASGDGRHVGRAAFEAGIHAELLSDDTRVRHRFRALEGEVRLNPLGVDVTAFHYDTSHESELPLTRVTTFWPRPRRHDVYLNIGWWVDSVGLQHRPRNSHHETYLRFIATGSSLDLWHDLAMSSFVRVRTGAAMDDLMLTREGIHHRVALTPISALEAEVLLGDAGQHRVTLETAYEAPIVWRDGANAKPSWTHRFDAELAYEVIAIAINDQPISLRLDGGGGYRNDVESAYSGWELRGGVGARVNFWAPAPSVSDAKRLHEMR